MGRKIKFRIWDKKYKDMYDVSTIHYDNKSQKITYICAANRGRGFMPEECVLMQYTGLKDKNGIEIFEGDIIESDKNCIFKCERKVGVVSFMDGGFILNKVWLTIVVESFKPEIVGNIYETVELLGGTK